MDLWKSEKWSDLQTEYVLTCWGVAPPSSSLCNCTFSYEISPVNISWVNCVSYFHLEWVKSQKLAVLGLDFYVAGCSLNLNSALLTLSVMPFGRSGHVTQAVYQYLQSENCSTIRTFLENQKKIKINLENPKQFWKSQNFLKIQKNPWIKNQRFHKNPNMSWRSKKKSGKSIFFKSKYEEKKIFKIQAFCLQRIGGEGPAWVYGTHMFFCFRKLQAQSFCSSFFTLFVFSLVCVEKLMGRKNDSLL